MSDTINVVINNDEEVIKITLLEKEPIKVSFFNVAIPDSRVFQAVTDAQQAASAASQSRNETEVFASSAQGSAQAASESAILAGEKAEEASSFVQTVSDLKDEAQGFANNASESASEASQSASNAATSASEAANSASQASDYLDGFGAKIIDSMAGTETDKAPSVNSIKEYVQAPKQLIVDLSNGLIQIGNFRFQEVSGELQIQKNISGTWTPIAGWLE